MRNRDLADRDQEADAKAQAVGSRGTGEGAGSEKPSMGVSQDPMKAPRSQV